MLLNYLSDRQVCNLPRGREHEFSVQSNILDTWESQLNSVFKENLNSQESHLRDEEALYKASSSFSEGRAILSAYHSVYGISVDPFNQRLNSLDTFGYSWPDFLIRFLKSDLGSIKTEDDLIKSLKVRGLPPVLVRSEDIIPYIDLKRVPKNFHNIFSNPELLDGVFNSHAFVRTPIKEEVIEKGLLPNFVVSGEPGNRVLQWINFSSHPEVGNLQQKLQNIISEKYGNKVIPAVALTSANVTKKTPETTDREGIVEFWANGRDLRKLLIPLLLHLSDDLYVKSGPENPYFYKMGSFPIYSLEHVSENKGVLHVKRIGNVHPELQQLVLNELGIILDDDSIPHNYIHPEINSEVLELLEASPSVANKSKILSLLTLGYSPSEIVNILSL